MITLTSKKKGFPDTESFFDKILAKLKLSSLDSWGRRGVSLLSSATPVDTGKTARSWFYKIIRTKDSVRIQWLNSNVNENVNIALIIQYGHVTRSGVYIEGLDYINPVVKPLMKQIEESAWKEVNSK